MANSQDIQDIISESSKKSLLDAQANASKLNSTLQDTILYTKAVNDNLSGTKSLAEFQKAAKEQSDSIAKIRKERQLSEAQALKIQQAEDARAAKKSKQITEESRLYNQLSKTLEKLRKDAQDIGVVYGTNSSQFEKAAAAVNKLDANLKNVDKSLGKSQRYVGEYERAGRGATGAYNGLSNSINQMSRELPAFTFSVQTGFLALSNNIPIFFDEIKRTRLEIAALKAEGQVAPSLFKQLTGALFSWGTALSIGITLLTVYGKEIGNFIGALFQGTKAMDRFALAQKDYNEVRRNGFKDAQTELQTLSNLYRASQNTELSLKERKKAVDELQKQYPATFKNLKDEDILAGKAADSYKYLTQQILATAMTAALSSKIAENRIRDFDNEEKRIKARAEYNKESLIIETALNKLRNPDNAGSARALANEAAKAEERRVASSKIIREANVDSEELNKRNLKYIQQIDEATKKYGITVLGVKDDENKSSTNTDSIDLLLQRAKNRQNELKDIAEKEKAKLQTRIDAAKEYGKVSDEIASLTAKKELQAAELTTDRIKSINEQKVNDIKENGRETTDLQVKIQEQANKALSDLLKEGLKEANEVEKSRIQDIMDGQNSRREQIEKDRSESAASTQEWFDKGKMKRARFDKEMFLIEKDASIKRIQLEIDTIQEIIDIQKQDLQFGIGSEKELSDNEKKLSDYRIALSKEESRQKNEIRDQDLDAEKERFQQLKELGQEIFNFSKQLVDGLFTARLDKLARESEQLEANKNLQIENVNESVLGEQEKADQIALINAQAVQQQEAIDAKVRETKRKQAIADKAFAISQAIINGALAMTKVAAQTGILTFAFSPLIAALTAVQVAAIVAQPIPKFKDGKSRNNNYEGLAYVGDGGQSELVINKDGSSWVTPATSTLTYVGRDTEVISGPELARMRMMAKPDAQEVSGTYVDVSGIINGANENTRRIEKAVGKLVGKQKRNNRAFDMQSWNAHLKRNGL